MTELVYFILDKDHNILSTRDVKEWARFFSLPDRIVKQETIGNVRVSTVFLGVDHGFQWLPGHEDDPPLLFETMIFGGEHNQYQERCTTWAEAEAMHAKAVAKVKHE